MFHCTQHISFICSFVDGHLSCLHLLAVVNNNSAMNLSVQIICLISFFHFFFGYIPEVDLLDCMVILCLLF